ncbi:hypothetical protein CD201_13890 [Hafnia alvei]|nr:hypothetical protein CD201_13890 [Hafnia alvei]
MVWYSWYDHLWLRLRSSSISARTAQNTITDLLFFLQEDSERSHSLIHRSLEMIEQAKSITRVTYYDINYR